MSIITNLSPVQYSNPLPESVDVVIIGAGIIGIATAWFLSKQGIKVAVCEKGRVAGEQSSRNWGWIRQQGRDEAELPIMMESLSIWDNLASEIGADIGFRREGSLYLCETEAELATYDKFLSFASHYGLKSEVIRTDKLYSLLTNTSRRWHSALHTASDARAEPEIAVTALAAACAREGVRIMENCAVRTIASSNARVDGVHTEHGFIKCSEVLCCGGAWTAALLHQCGIELPQLSVKASVATTGPAPMIFNGEASGSGLAFRRREDGGYTIAMTDYLEVFPSAESLLQFRRFIPLLRIAHKKLRLRIGDNLTARFFGSRSWREDDITPFELDRVTNPIPGQKTLARLRSRLDDRLPILRDVAITQSWSGMIDATPDAVPVMDKVTKIGGLFIATGFSGHGFGIGPAAGRIMADMIQNNNTGHDLSRFRFSRFSDGSKIIPGPSI